MKPEEVFAKWLSEMPDFETRLETCSKTSGERSDERGEYYYPGDNYPDGDEFRREWRLHWVVEEIRRQRAILAADLKDVYVSKAYGKPTLYKPQDASGSQEMRIQ